ncbi:MAG: hypothetical protein AB1413_06775 [Thermodesulfobacteriota bacterium]
MSRTVPAALLLALLASPAMAEEFSFDPAEIEPPALEWGGYAEVKWEHSDLNQRGALRDLLFYQGPRSTLDRLGTALQLDGRYTRDLAALKWVARATAAQDELAWSDTADLYEGYLSLKPAPDFVVDLGKKTFKWGKGYAWNPVGFIDRPKDPNDPEEALEGFIGAGFDAIRSFAGSPLQTVALTAVALPVWQGVNEDFGARDNVNLAAKLYFLFYDTDIDLIASTGNSRSSRFGVDFSRNLAANLEIHGEIAHTPHQSMQMLDASSMMATQMVSDTSWLLGLRHLSERDLTTIVEIYHNDDGYTEAEQARFFDLVADGMAQYESTGATTLLSRAANASQLYSRPQTGRNYLYARLSQKDPLDILYLNPGLTLIANLDDQSWSLAPEMVYTGFTNWELRLRLNVVGGDANSEYDEKRNSNTLEARLRSFF